MVTLQWIEKRKKLSNQVKITFKMSENHSEVSENHLKKSENHYKRVNFTLRGSTQRDSSKQKSCPSVSFPKKWNSL